MEREGIKKNTLESYEKSLNNHLIQDGAEILLNVSDLLSFLKDN